MKVIGIKETCLYAKDLDAAILFYHNKLAFPIHSHLANQHVFFIAGNTMLLVFNPLVSGQKKSPPGHYGSGQLHLAFEVKKEEYDSKKEEILRLNIPIIDTYQWRPGYESFYFHDPFLNICEIIPEGLWGN